ncbi:DUF4372 domain-containing protein [Kiritimatiella glycovorans]|uniref:DUF4372 domain-containing protein n=1 Tax=Kiritimatiella glycovorans TaxID=1307763 RepID=A0A0G3ED04_9BACT|nr:hypothetical protein L21SP4_01084 [Kiritimatiella glycovorans]
MLVSRAAGKSAIFRQACELIPSHIVPKDARKHGIKSRGITPWSRLVSIIYAKFTHAIGLNDVVDALCAHGAPMARIRGANSPSRNGLSHANETRDPKMALRSKEALFGPSHARTHPDQHGRAMFTYRTPRTARLRRSSRGVLQEPQQAAPS